MRRNFWSSVFWKLFLAITLSGMVLSTTLKDLAIVRENLLSNVEPVHKLMLLSGLNQSLSHEGVFIGSGELTTASMGNLLATYFDALACSKIVGVHFVYNGSIVGDEQTTKFFNSFPQIRVHPNPSSMSSEKLSEHWKETCPYVVPYPLVHEGAWNQQPHMIAQIVRNAVSAVFPTVLNETIPLESFSHILPKRMPLKVLPLVPSAAIVFRCVDILFFTSDKPNYGFLNFNTYKELIPQNATTIYVLSEQLNYRNLNSGTSKDCRDLGGYLIEYLHKQFPQAIVALRRGYAIDSVAMLSNAATVVSAPSSFPLFPGIANPNRVYLMASGKRPVYFDQPHLHKNFMWLYSPAVIMGGDVVKKDRKNSVKKLKKALTQSLSQPVAYATHLPKKDYCADIIPPPAECLKFS